MFALQSDIKPKTLLKINYNLVDIQTAVNEQLAFSFVLSYQKYWFFFLLSFDYLFSLENSFLNKKKKNLFHACNCTGIPGSLPVFSPFQH